MSVERAHSVAAGSGEARVEASRASSSLLVPYCDEGRMPLTLFGKAGVGGMAIDSCAGMGAIGVLGGGWRPGSAVRTGGEGAGGYGILIMHQSPSLNRSRTT